MGPGGSGLELTDEDNTTHIVGALWGLRKVHIKYLAGVQLVVSA